MCSTYCGVTTIGGNIITCSTELGGDENSVCSTGTGGGKWYIFSTSVGGAICERLVGDVVTKKVAGWCVGVGQWGRKEYGFIFRYCCSTGTLSRVGEIGTKACGVDVTGTTMCGSGIIFVS